MRPIKFRIWDTKENRWETWGFGLDVDQELCYLYDGIGDGRKDRYVFQQYTGLKDRNGKEIYEGDIVEYPFYGDLDYLHKDTMEVVFNHYKFCLNSTSKTYGRVDLPLSADKQHIEIIGNTYENPELIK